MAREMVRETTLLALKNGGRELQAKERRQPPEAGKGREMDCVVELPERNATLPTPWP